MAIKKYNDVIAEEYTIEDEYLNRYISRSRKEMKASNKKPFVSKGGKKRMYEEHSLRDHKGGRPIIVDEDYDE